MISAPMPRPAPVMSHTFFSVMPLHFLLVDLRAEHRVIGGALLPNQPARAGGRHQ